MEENYNQAPFLKKRQNFFKYVKSLFPFFLGGICALIFGWWIFPNLMLKEQQQPVLFSHDTHLKNGLECKVCHYLRPDGSFSGIPTTGECIVCHKEILGKTIEEKEYFDVYVSGNKEVAWLEYQKQPDNVFFSHAAHSLQACNVCHEYSEQEVCMLCHIDVTKAKSPVEVKENRLTTYTTETMKMWQCEECHANPNHLDATNASNACFVCHK